MAAHVHAELMMALALNDELVIELRNRLDGRWEPALNPTWHPMMQYRIKPAGPVINLEIAGMTNDVLEVMESDLPNHNYDFATVDAIHEFAQLFARKLVKQCAAAADMGAESTKYVGDYIIESLGYENGSL